MFSICSPKLRRRIFAAPAPEEPTKAMAKRCVSHGDESGFSVARETFDGDMFGVDGAVGFEIVERATGTPSPSAECAPIVRRARLAFVDETNDAFGEAGAVVGLHAGGNERGITPAFGEDLLLPGGADTVERGPSFGSETPFYGSEDFGAQGKLHNDRNGRGGVGGSGEGELNVDGDEWVRRTVDVADEFFGDDGNVFVNFAGGTDDFPADTRPLAGTRPRISRSKSSTICGRRCVHQI